MGGARSYISRRSSMGAEAACRGRGPSARRFLLGLARQNVLTRFGVNAFGRVGARMARLGHVAAIKGAKGFDARASARTVPVPIPEGDEDRKDHFVTRNGVTFAGSHLIVDLWEAE